MLVVVLAPLAFVLGFAVGARWSVGVAVSVAVGVLAGVVWEFGGLPQWFVGVVAAVSTAAGFAVGAAVRRGERIMPRRRSAPPADQGHRRAVTPATAEDPDHAPAEPGRPAR